MTELRVLVVDDQQLVREGIASLLGLQPGLRVVATAGDAAAAVDAVGTHDPHVVLLDVRMPGTDGFDTLTAIRQLGTACRIVMLTTFDDDEYVHRALAEGADGYLLKTLPAAELAGAIRIAHAGVAPIAGSVARRLATSLPVRKPAPSSELTPRETDVLRHIATGATNREIARRLFVSEGTVKNHISRILARWQLRDRTQAVIYARDNGWL